jgi:hypothetical protein
LAEKLIRNIQSWLGTAAERVAMSTTGVQAGSTFEETDTGLIYKWSGTAWFENPINVQSNTANASASQTRPDNATPYTAYDVIGTDPATVFTFANVVKTAGNTAIITGVSLRIDVNALPTGMETFRLHLYDASPTAIVDNGAFNLIAADRSKYLGYIDIDLPLDMGDTLYIENLNINKQIKTVTTSIFGQLQTKVPYTPTAQAVKTIELQIVEV